MTEHDRKQPSASEKRKSADHQTTEDIRREDDAQAIRELPQVAASGTPIDPNTLSTNTILYLQRTIGNQATQRLIYRKYSKTTKPRLIQRQEAPQMTEAEPATEDGVFWKVPTVFMRDGKKGKVFYRDDAIWGLMMIQEQIENLEKELHAGTYGDLLQLLGETKGKCIDLVGMLHEASNPQGRLTAEEVHGLDFLQYHIQDVKEAIGIVRSQMVQHLSVMQKPPDPNQITKVKTEVGEKLHMAFMKQRQDSTTSRLKEAYDAIDSYKQSADEVVGWATDFSKLLDAEAVTGVLNLIGEKSGKLGEGMQKVKNALEWAENLETLFGGDRASGNFGDVARFQAAIGTIDNVMSLPIVQSIPLLGQLWSNYFMPVLTFIIDRLQYIAEKATEKDLRFEWHLMRQATSSGETPQIPSRALDNFPGGQPVLDFMWDIMHDKTPQRSASAMAFFLSRVDSFNAGSGDDLILVAKLHARQGLGMNVNLIHNVLVKWAQQNKNLIWVQLYGNFAGEAYAHLPPN